jgi:ribosomal protein S18 acetylase RimI-like enzyme
VSGLTIRSATTGDAETVLRLWREADAVVSTTDDLDALGVLLDRDPESLLIADVDGACVGTLIVGWDGWRANLYRLAVLPTWRRRGIGRALVEAAEARLRARGARRAAAVVVTDHEHAGAFWRSMHYELDERLGRFAKMLSR